MRKTAKMITSASAVATLLGVLAVTPQLVVAADASMAEEGKKIAFDRKKGNCLACHQIEGGDLPGNIGPPLIAMQQRFPDKSKLRAQISEPRKNNPNSMMPPFGPHEILTDSEIDKVVEFIHTL